MIGTLTLAVMAVTMAATPCEGLKNISLPNTTITTAVLVPEGARTPRKALTDDELVEIPYEPEKHRVADPAPGKRNPMRPAGASRTQRDANAEYARMMAERQARMEKGR